MYVINSFHLCSYMHGPGEKIDAFAFEDQFIRVPISYWRKFFFFEQMCCFFFGILCVLYICKYMVRLTIGLARFGYSWCIVHTSSSSAILSCESSGVSFSFKKSFCVCVLLLLLYWYGMNGLHIRLIYRYRFYICWVDGMEVIEWT